MKKANVVFLDRDGVINEYPGNFQYVCSPQELRILPGVAGALARLVESGYRLFVVSNQAGVSKGLYTARTLDRITQKMIIELGTRVTFDGVYYCMHRSDEACACRKPRTGLIDQAVARLNQQGYDIDRKKSFLVGDSEIDIQTGANAGIPTILVFSGRAKPGEQLAWSIRPDFVAADAAHAVERILSQ